jgi:hypothetical protein
MTMGSPLPYSPMTLGGALLLALLLLLGLRQATRPAVGRGSEVPPPALAAMLESLEQAQAQLARERAGLDELRSQLSLELEGVRQAAEGAATRAEAAAAAASVSAGALFVPRDGEADLRDLAASLSAELSEKASTSALRSLFEDVNVLHGSVREAISKGTGAVEERMKAALEKVEAASQAAVVSASTSLLRWTAETEAATVDKIEALNATLVLRVDAVARGLEGRIAALAAAAAVTPTQQEEPAAASTSAEFSPAPRGGTHRDEVELLQIEVTGVRDTLRGVQTALLALDNLTARLAAAEEALAARHAAEPSSRAAAETAAQGGARVRGFLVRHTWMNGSVREGLLSGEGVHDEGVANAIEATLLRTAADGVGMPDFALASAGGQVLEGPTLTSPTWMGGSTRKAPAAHSGPGSAAYYRGPYAALDRDTSPGRCWPVAGGYAGHPGLLAVRLAAPVVVTSVTVDHHSRELTMSPPGGPSPSAPKDFALFGLPTPDAAGVASAILLGRFAYDATGPATQVFHLEAGAQGPFPAVQLVIDSNHGATDFTCLYRLRVHAS